MRDTWLQFLHEEITLLKVGLICTHVRSFLMFSAFYFLASFAPDRDASVSVV
jgi:hypothetical protein